MIRLAVFALTLFFAAPAMACMYDAGKADKNIENAVFIGTVKIVKVEHPENTASATRPRVTYEVVEAQKRAEGFDDNIIVIESDVLTSCDFAGPWDEGETVQEIFYKEGDKLFPSNINMRVGLDNANNPVSEGR